MNKILSLSLLLLAGICLGQTSEQNLSKEAIQTIQNHCGKAKIINTYPKEQGIVEVVCSCNNQPVTLVLKDNRYLFTVQKLTSNDIPFDAIAKKIKKRYDAFDWYEISKITTTEQSYYEIKILKDLIAYNLCFTLEGKWLKLKPIGVSEQWNFKNIEKNTTYAALPYVFHLPTNVYDMPEALREISGVTLYENQKVYAVQDELGTIFEYDLKKEEITNLYRFTDVGDFEDIAIYQQYAFVLRSDGHLFQYDLNQKKVIKEISLAIPSLDIEGLCFADDYAYIACKSACANETNSKRIIYRSSVKNIEKIEKYLEINIEALTTFLTSHYPELGINNLQFNPSAIAIHPKTKEMYILSAEDRIIVVFKDKQLKNVIPLSTVVFYKPEGMSFYENGDLLISSEGDKKGLIKGSISVLTAK